MKKLLVVLLAATSVAAFADEMQGQANPAMASANSSSNSGLGNNNLYVGAAAGAAWNNIQAPAASFRVDGGYNFNQNWALEVGTTGVTQSGGTANQSMQFYDLSIKGTMPLGDSLALFAQVGGAYGSPGATSGTGITPGMGQAGWDFLTGAGIQVNLTPQVSMNLSDLYYYGAPNPQGNTNVVLAGLKYNF